MLPLLCSRWVNSMRGRSLNSFLVYSVGAFVYLPSCLSHVTPNDGSIFYFVVYGWLRSNGPRVPPSETKGVNSPVRRGRCEVPHRTLKSPVVSSSPSSVQLAHPFLPSTSTRSGDMQGSIDLNAPRTPSCLISDSRSPLCPPRPLASTTLFFPVGTRRRA